MIVLLALAVPLMVIFFALWVGVPTWLVLRHPDERPKAAAVYIIRGLSELRGDHRHAA
jgi:hypothetical protein